MAKRGPIVAIDDELPVELTQEQKTLEEIDALLSEGGDTSGLKIMVKELVQEPGKRQMSEAWLFDVTADELDGLREKLLDECGPGRYRVRVFGANRRQMSAYDIAVTKPKRARDAERAASLAPRTPSPATEDPLQKLLLERLEKLERTQNATTGVLEAIAARLATPPPAAAAAPLSGLKETIETMGAMIALLPRPDPNIGLNMFTQGMNMAKQVYELREGGGESDGGLTGMLGKLLESPLLAGLVQNATAPKQNGHRAPAPEPLRVPGAGLAAGAAPASPAANPNVAALAETMNYLIIKASENVSPALCVDYLEENLPDDAWIMLQQSSDPIGELAKIFPAVTTYRPWFNALLDKLAEPVETEGDAGGGRHAMRMQQPRV